MFGLGLQELVVILIIILVLFGATRIPQMMRGFGTGVREFKSALKDDDAAKTEAQDTKSENSEDSSK